MRVSDLMTKNPTTINQNCTLHVAMDIMEKLSCHHLPVISEDRHLIGILSDHDCRKALQIWDAKWHYSKLAHRLLARAVITPAPIVIEADSPAHEAARLMLAGYIRCLPVMRGETLVGIVTTSDLLIAFMYFDKGDGENHETFNRLRERTRLNR